MIVKINWGTGGMSVDADYLLEEMPLKNFRKWCELFAIFGDKDTHIALNTYVIERIIRKEKSAKQCSERYREMEERNLKRYKKVHSIIKDVLYL